MAKAASPVLDLQERFLQCRFDRRHTYDPKKHRWALLENGKLVQHDKICMVCGLKVTMFYFTRTGARDGRPTVTYPDGYLIKGQGRVEVEDVRREMILRKFPELKR